MTRKHPETAGLEYEKWYWKAYRHIVGIDEAGRGAWAGPVAAGAVCLPIDDGTLATIMKGVRDSKQMSARQREALVDTIKNTALAWGIGAASSDEIDAMGIVPATKLAMARALDDLMRDGLPVDCLFLDSMPWDEIQERVPCHQVNIKYGDRHSLSIAAASILAKTWRDEHMRELDQQYPQYVFASHKGYGTTKHLDAIKTHGVLPVIHRTCYRPIQELMR